MAEQNFKNHTRLVPGFHGVTFLLIVTGLVGSVVNLFHADAATHYSAALLVVVFLALLGVAWYCLLYTSRCV